MTKGIDWIVDSQLDNGGIPTGFIDGCFSKTERGDALCQSIRLIILAIENDLIGEKHIEPLFLMVRRLLQFQCRKSGVGQRGGLYYMMRGNQIEINNINSWVTMFGIQAIHYFMGFCEGNTKTDLEYLL